MGKREGITMDTMLRVKNNVKYDIGVVTISGQQTNIPAGGTTMLQVKDILLIEANYPAASFFGSKKLLVIDDNNNELNMSDIGGYDNFSTAEKNLTDAEIKEMLSGSAKKIEAWMETITDAGNRESIFQMAQKMDLPTSKINVLEAAMPEKIWHWKDN